MPTDGALNAVLGLLSLGALAGAFVWLLRGAGIWGGRPAAAVVAGVLAGVLLGPAGVGKVAPGVHQQYLRGGVAELRDLERVLARQRADRAALVATGGDAGAFAEMAREHERESAPLRDAYEGAVRGHRWKMGVGVAVLVGLGFFLGAWAGRARRPGSAALLTATLAVGLEIVVMVVLLRWVAGAPMGVALGVGAAGAAGSVFVGVPMRWVGGAGRTALARGVAPVMVLGAGVAMLIAAPGEGRWLVGAVIGAAAAGWVVRGIGVEPGRARGAAGGVALWAAVPTAAAAVTAAVDWGMVGAGTLPLLVAGGVLLLSGNGAFLGLVMGVRTGGDGSGRGGAAAEVLAWQPDGYGATQVCFAALLLGAGVVDPGTAVGSAVLAGLVLSAAVGETMLGWAARVMAAEEKTRAE